jgi:quercetin dioxygenase-like cupin family protein
MSDTSVKKVSADHSPQGVLGQTYLASGKHMSMRLWQEEAGDAEEKGAHTRDYETVGFVIEGKAELHLEDQTITLEEGDSWVVPEGAEHTYKVHEHFKAVEATSPPARAHARDE